MTNYQYNKNNLRCQIDEGSFDGNTEITLDEVNKEMQSKMPEIIKSGQLLYSNQNKGNPYE